VNSEIIIVEKSRRKPVVIVSELEYNPTDIEIELDGHLFGVGEKGVTLELTIHVIGFDWLAHIDKRVVVINS